MTKYPDVTMIKCPVRGIVFYADGLGELAFHSAASAQAACDKYRAQRELSEKEFILTCLNRVECTERSIRIITEGEEVYFQEFNSIREVRQKIGTLPEWSTHKFVWI